MKLAHRVVILCLIAGIHAPLAVADTYTNETYGFSMSPPDFPPAAEGSAVQPVTFLAAPTGTFVANCNVQVQHVAFSLAESEALTESQFDALGWTVEEKSYRDVSEHEAVVVQYSATIGGISTSYLALAVPVDARVYLLTCVATSQQFPDYREAFQTAIDSFRID